MLEARELKVSYGAAPAVNGVTLKVEPGALVVVVGPNGAGKTTLINAIAGVQRVQAGTLAMDGIALNGVSPHRFCEHGIALVPEGRRLFTGLTVRENLELGGYRAAARARRAQSLREVCTLFPVLAARLEAPAGTLSGGQQQMVAIGRALMAQPRLLLLDEPSLGLAPAIVQTVLQTIRELNREGLTCVLVEQNVAVSLKLAKFAYVLENGRITLSGSGEELLADDRVRQAYLGM
jgi:branched-chain amino acid transport system ATP-binding protein